MKEESQIAEKALFENFSSPEQYKKILAKFDAALCEGCAVSQAASGQCVHATLGYATHVFTRILAHARTLIRSVPKNRWSTSDFEDWDFGANAANFRSIMEASLLFHYLCDADASRDNQRAIVQLMHLYDLTKRKRIIHDDKVNDEFEETRSKIVERLKSTQRFNALSPNEQKNALKGKWLMLESKEEIMKRIGWNEKHFYLLWNLTSQYAHVFSLAFYRIEPNGRGTGMENNFDRKFLASGLEICAAVITDITDTLCEHFPDAIRVRNGVHSKFSPGPYRNLPQLKKRAMNKKKKTRRK